MPNRRAWSRYLKVGGLDGAHKYGARATWFDGIRFDSKREAARYVDLTILRAAGLIRDLQIQPRFPLLVMELAAGGGAVADRATMVQTIAAAAGMPWVVRSCGHYTADFRYVDTTTGEVVIEDVKSGPTKTTAYRLRKRLVEAIHGVTIREV